MLPRPKADKANSGRHVYPLDGRTSELRRGRARWIASEGKDAERGAGRQASVQAR